MIPRDRAPARRALEHGGRGRQDEQLPAEDLGEADLLDGGHPAAAISAWTMARTDVQNALRLDVGWMGWPGRVKL